MSEDHSDYHWVAQHALVLGSSDHVQPNTIEPAQSAPTTIQSDSTQESVKPKSACVAPRASAIKEQGFSEAVAARIEATQRGSTRSVYEAKWTIFTKWRLSNQMNFRAPSIKSVADFLMYLFQDRKLKPSTIDGSRSAIADKFLDSFHRDRPKQRRRIPSWNLSLMLHQLTYAPVEPIKEASLKHLFFMTVFLLALWLGKRRNEIHAWQNKNIRHQTDWWKVSLYTSPSFLSKNWMAKEGPVWPQWLYQPWPRLWISPSSLTDPSVRSEYCTTIWTGPQAKQGVIVFISFKKHFDKTSPLPLSPRGSSILRSYVMSSLIRRPSPYIRSKTMMSGPLLLLTSKACQSGVSRRWFCHPATGSHIITSHSSGRMWLWLIQSFFTWAQ